MTTLTITEHHGADTRSVHVDDQSDALELARIALGFAPTTQLQAPGTYRAARAGGAVEIEISNGPTRR